MTKYKIMWVFYSHSYDDFKEYSLFFRKCQKKSLQVFIVRICEKDI